MNALLLDTTVASLLSPGKKGKLADWYRGLVEFKTLAICYQTVAELLRWAVANKWGRPRRLELESIIRRLVLVPLDFELCRTWARVMTESERQGRRLEAGDGWVAATAVHFGIPLVTHDRDQVELKLDGSDVYTAIGESNLE